MAPHPASIHKRHADHLYDKGDFEGSVIVYSDDRRLNRCCHSEVLDSQQMPNLVYLEAYHRYVQEAERGEGGEGRGGGVEGGREGGKGAKSRISASSAAVKLMREHTTATDTLLHKAA